MPSLASTAGKRKRYAIVGVGGRSNMFSSAILKDYRKEAELVALCDLNQTRMDYYNRKFQKEFKHSAVPTYFAKQFEKMIKECRPDTVIVTTKDSIHHDYMIRAMKMGCDVITEKPMTTNVESCKKIIDCVKKTGQEVRVSFNYRYSPLRTKTKELIQKGVIGEIKSVHFEWLLDTIHGADYFRRWHREKRNSGGLMVHKSTHHFDLVNWWLDSSPDVVFGFGSLAFYGRENAKKRGIKKFYDRGSSPLAKGDPFALNLKNNKHAGLGKTEALSGLYLHAEHEDGYLRDRSVFDKGITIEDTMNVLVRYKSGAQMTYALTAYSPWEGYRIAFNGTQGRIDAWIEESNPIDEKSYDEIVVTKNFGTREFIRVSQGSSGHGGGDKLLKDKIFGGVTDDPLHQSASVRDGALSILVGIAARKSCETGVPVRIGDLTSIKPGAKRQFAQE